MKGSGRSTRPGAQTAAVLDGASDAALGAALHDGEESALASLYDRHMHDIYDFLARYLRDPHTAEDLTQSTFVRAWERRETLREPSGVRAWLFTIAHNLATNQLTRSRPAEPIEERFDLAAPGPGPEQEIATRESAQLVWAAASSLESRQYAVLDLCIRRELSTREVADALGTSVGHAAVLVNRAKEALGNAVRYLLVAQRREQCERLAALVPAGIQALTPELRTAVDHHMRRCDACRNLGRRLTSPAELFGGLVALPVPGSLRGERREYVLRSARRHQTSQPGRADARWPRLAKRAVVFGGLALLALGTILAEVHVQGPGAPATRAPNATGSPSLGSPGPTGGSQTAAPLAVRRVRMTANDPSTSGCPQTHSGYRCTFTVVIDLDPATADARTAVTLTGDARGPGGKSQTRTGTFSADVPAGARTVSMRVSLLFDVTPCASQQVRAQPSTAVAAVREPEAVNSDPVPFGAACTSTAATPTPQPTVSPGRPSPTPTRSPIIPRRRGTDSSPRLGGGWGGAHARATSNPPTYLPPQARGEDDWAV